MPVSAIGGGALVSVIVPVHNSERFLKGSIESVLGQTWTAWELILVDDGSSDGSAALCRQYAGKDARVRVFTQPNAGPAAARNTGLRQAAGAYVFFLDADDRIDARALEVLLAGYDNGEADLVMGNFDKHAASGEVTVQRVAFHPDNAAFTGEQKSLDAAGVREYVRHFLKHPSNHLISYCWGRLYRASIIRAQAIAAHEDMRLFEDFVFNLDYLKHVRQVVFVNRPLYTYVMHEAHVSASMAMVRAESLRHDMAVFKAEAEGFLRGRGVDAVTAVREVGHALTHYTIIFIVRTCRQLNARNETKVCAQIDQLIKAPIVAESLRAYTPSRGNSRVLALLMKLKWTILVMAVAKYKAYKRYGRPQGV